MRRVGSIVIILCIVLSMAPVASAGTAGSVVISELMMGSANNTREEFIELYNGSSDYLDFSSGQWRLQIASSTAKDWTSPLRTIVLTGYLHPGFRYLIGSKFTQTVGGNASESYFPVVADAYYAAALSASGGHVRLVKVDGAGTASVVDELEWGTTNAASSIDGRSIFRTTAAIKAGQSLERSTDADAIYMDSDKDGVDFALTDYPTPETTTSEQPPPVLPPIDIIPSPVDMSDPEETNLNDTMALQITELLPNPADPLTDANDEYVELFNPNPGAVNLRGYSLQSGLTTRRTYKISSDTYIQAGGYLVFYAKQTKLSLSNTGGQAHLLDPSGATVAESGIYGKALDGLVWENDGGVWQWSGKQTPATTNQFVTPLAALAKPLSTIKKTTKSSGVKTTAKKKVTTKPAKKSTKKTVQTTLAAEKQAKPNPIHTTILAAVLGIALLYGAYEYRQELANRFRQLTGNRRAGRRYWPKFKRRRVDPTGE